MNERRFALLGVCPALLLLLAVVVLPLAMGGRTLFLRDVIDAHLPLKHAQAEAMAEGRLPLVDPYRGGGQALLGNLNGAPLYPTNLLYLVAPVLWAMNAHFWFHLLLAPLAMGWLARAWGLGRGAAWCAGLVYGTGGFFLSHLSFFNLIAGAVVAPALAAAALEASRGARRWPLPLLGGLWALLLLGGDPSTAVLALALAGSALFTRWGLRVPRGGWLFLALAAGTLVALPQLVETARIAGSSFRGFYGLSDEARSAGSFDPRQVVEWLLPYFFGRPDSIGYGRFWGQRFYTDWQPFYFSLAPGLLPLALAAAAGRGPGRAGAWAWGTVGAGLFFALGGFNPLAAGLLALPGARLFRYPIKFWLLVAVGAALLAGLGLERLLRQEVTAWRRYLAALAVLGALLLTVMAVIVLAPEATATAQEHLLPAIYPADFLAFEARRWRGTATLGLAVAAGLALGGVLLKRRPELGAAALVVVHTASQLVFQAPNRSTEDARVYAEPPPLRALVPAGALLVHGSEGELFGRENLVAGDYPDDHVRWLDRRTQLELYPGGGVPWGVHYDLNASPEGLDSFLIAAAADLVQDAPDDRERLRLLAGWGVTHLVVTRPLEPADLARVRVLGQARVYGAPVALYALTSPAPRAAFLGRVERAEHINRAVERLRAPGFDPRERVVVAGAGPELAGEGGEATVVEWAPERLVVEVEARSPGVLVLQRSLLPIFRATVGGRPVPLLAANLCRMGVELPAGRHRVVVETDRRPLAWSLAASLAGLLGLVALSRVRGPAPRR